MRSGIAILLAIGMVTGLASTVGAADDQVLPAAAEASCASSVVAPPCGWINPQLSLELADARACRDDYGVDCMPVPTADQPAVFEGQFVLKWDISEEGTYTADPQDPVVVTFRGTGSNPSFLDFDIEPEEFVLDATTLNDPRYHTTKERSDGSNAVWYEYTEPVTVTINRVAEEPTLDDVERIDRKFGEIQFLIRIHSDSSGSTFKDSYGLKAFYFHVGAAYEDDVPMQLLAADILGPEYAAADVAGAEANEAPVTPLPFVAAGLAAAVALMRRRRD